MYKFSYAEILEDSSFEARERERMAFDRAIELLVAAEAPGAAPKDVQTAVLYVQQLWCLLIRDLSDPNNAFEQQLRADLISIGLWIIKEADDVLQERSQNIAGLISVNRSIRDGLQ